MKTEQQIIERLFNINEQIILLSKQMDEIIFMDEEEYNSLAIMQHNFHQESNTLRWVLDKPESWIE